jgi:hypothetical protein
MTKPQNITSPSYWVNSHPITTLNIVQKNRNLFFRLGIIKKLATTKDLESEIGFTGQKGIKIFANK